MSKKTLPGRLDRCGRNVRGIVAGGMGYLILASLLSVIGCASAGSDVREIASPSRPLGGYSVLSLKTTQANSLHLNISSQLEALLEEQLRTQRLYQRVLMSGMPGSPDLILDVRFTRVNDVSSTERSLTGGMRGQALVAARVSLIDVASNHEVAAFNAEGRSSGGSAFAGTTDDAVMELSNAIVEYLAKHR